MVVAFIFPLYFYFENFDLEVCFNNDLKVFMVFPCFSIYINRGCNTVFSMHHWFPVLKVVPKTYIFEIPFCDFATLLFLMSWLALRVELKVFVHEWLLLLFKLNEMLQTSLFTLCLVELQERLNDKIFTVNKDKHFTILTVLHFENKDVVKGPVHFVKPTRTGFVPCFVASQFREIVFIFLEIFWVLFNLRMKEKAFIMWHFKV